MSRSDQRLAALFVNYRSGAYLRRAVASLFEEWRRSGRWAEHLEVVVVDCASGPGDEPHLRMLEGRGVRVLRSARNLGYAGGMNLAFGSLTNPQTEADCVALLNPDIEFLPGSIDPLLGALRDPGVGVVGPRTWFTPARDFLMPTLVLPSFAQQLGELAARVSPPWAREHARRASRLRRRLWESSGAVEVDMLSGACLFLRRDRVDALGTPLDGEYPLYFEDADLCRRLGEEGLGVLLVPAAEIAHCGARSSGQGASFRPEAARRWTESRARYLDLHAGEGALRVLEGFESWVDRRAPDARDQVSHPVVDLGPVRGTAPRFEWDSQDRVLLEVALGTTFGLAAGRYVEGGAYTLGDQTLASLFPGRYLVRALDPIDDRVLGCWSFESTEPAVLPDFEGPGVEALLVPGEGEARPKPRESTARRSPSRSGFGPPRALDRPRRGSVLCLAPHADDEVLGCGGTLRKHIEQGDEVQVIVAFDGAAGLEPGAEADLRHREALRGGARLGVDRYTFWDYPEGHPPVGPTFEGAVATLVAWIEQHRPRWIYAPWAGEQHPDHRSVALALERALAQLRIRGIFDGEALGYEVWTPLIPDRVIDISDVIDHKRAALAEHRSQSGVRDLAHCGLGMNAQRSSFLRKEARFGEAFLAWDSMMWVFDSDSSRDPSVADGGVAA